MSVIAEGSPNRSNQFVEKPLWQKLAVIGAQVASGAVIMNETTACDPLPQRTLEAPVGVEVPMVPVP